MQRLPARFVVFGFSGHLLRGKKRAVQFIESVKVQWKWKQKVPEHGKQKHKLFNVCAPMKTNYMHKGTADIKKERHHSASTKFQKKLS